MHDVVYSLSISVDGYIYGPDGSFDWSVPDAGVFDVAMDEIRNVGVHLLGTRLYEAMVYWETAEAEEKLDAAEVEFARIWKALPKVVFTHSLTSVVGNSRIASGTIADEIAALKAEPGNGDIAIGGADLAAQIADLNLIDEYRIRLYPVLVGGGQPYFAHHRRFEQMRLVENRVLDQVVYLRYRSIRQP